jgi:hypothetical protein
VACDRNLYFNPKGGAARFGALAWEAWRARGRDGHSLLADPRFIDPDRGNFGLREGSPALQVGFVPPDWSRVGPRPAKADRPR